MIITDARIDGVRAAVVIDTGAQNSIANPVLLRKLRARERHEIVSVDVLGIQLTSRATFLRSLQIGRAEMTNVQIGFADSPIFAALGLSRRPALVLGMNNLRVFDRVAIDFSTKRILFDMPSRRAERTTPGRRARLTRTLPSAGRFPRWARQCPPIQPLPTSATMPRAGRRSAGSFPISGRRAIRS